MKNEDVLFVIYIICAIILIICYLSIARGYKLNPIFLLLHILMSYCGFYMRKIRKK